MRSVSRRGFLINSAAAAALTGCGIRTPTHDVSRDASLVGTFCDTRDPTGPIRIDAHCHFLNLRDLSAGPFIARRFLDYDESAVPGVDAVVGFAAGTVAEVLKLATVRVGSEVRLLDVALQHPDYPKPAFREPAKFCKFAEKFQKGPFKAVKRNQLTGMFSNKMRNAGRIAEAYPSIDIFMPSMVDLYDDRRSMKSIPAQLSFYERLNVATAGRYLPLASFNPQRAYQVAKAGKNTGEASYLEQVKHAVLHRGFVGIKVHPSSGFSPIDNHIYGCTNTATQIVTEDDQELFDRFTAYDELMAELFSFCAEHDVPVLTHGSTGLTSNRRCMRGPRNPENGTRRPAGPRRTAKEEWGYQYRNWGRIGGEDSNQPLEWSNSPVIWDRATRKFKFKICLSHFADSLKVDEKAPGGAIVKPSPWLIEAVKVAENNPYVFIDLSIITEFFWRDREGRYGLRPGYLSVFRQLNQHYPNLRTKLIYGTDWHMPGTARLGPVFLSLIERLLDEGGLSGEKTAIMGTRAADLYGLSTGRRTRTRLERFYSRKGRQLTGRPLTTADIDWMRKLG